MKRRFLVSLVLACAAVSMAPSAQVHAAEHSSSKVNILAMTEVPGTRNTYASVYSVGTLRLGVSVGDPRHHPYIWSRSLKGSFVSLFPATESGSFGALTRGPGSREGSLYAYRLHGSRVSSAVAGHLDGVIFADEGIQLNSAGFTTKRSDETHRGNVKYRFLRHYLWKAGEYRPASSIRVPDYAPEDYPTPSALLHTSRGDTILVRVEVANTPEARNTGLMNRTVLDPDAGMLFVWSQLSTESFWMVDTPIPLSICFLGSDGKIQEIQNMEPMSSDLHSPVLPYKYALEVNQNFFTANGIHTGDYFELHPDTGAR